MTKELRIVGGVYWEYTTRPKISQIYGSGGRAAAALSGADISIKLTTYASAELEELFRPLADSFEISLECVASRYEISFNYFDWLSEPLIVPGIHLIKKNDPVTVISKNILRFGMLEGSAIVQAKSCVYDPQCTFAPEPFVANGSKCDNLAIIGNSEEIGRLGSDGDIGVAARRLLQEGAKVVIIKQGPDGARVISEASDSLVSAYSTGSVWKIGSGDVFSASFAAAWCLEGKPAEEAAAAASIAVAYYADTRNFPCYPCPLDLPYSPARKAVGTVYLAGPFFTSAQLWLIEKAKQAFESLGVKVFSPYHDVGQAGEDDHESIDKKDLDGLDKSDTIFAMLDGLDAGTLFEIGYARSHGKSVWIFSEAVKNEDLVMLDGTGCKIIDDFPSAVYRTVWQS